MVVEVHVKVKCGNMMPMGLRRGIPGRGRTVTKNQGGYQARYNYRFGDKLKDVTSNFPGEAATVYYNYDGLGKRRCKTLDLATVTWWRWDHGYNVIQEYADPDDDWDIENLTLTYTIPLAGVLGSNPSTGSYFYASLDHLGSVRNIRDQNKNSVASYEYMPFGESYLQSGLVIDFGFAGLKWESNLNIYYAPYRYYSPVTSRWLTRDPLGMIDGPNVYAYVRDNPINKADPRGLSMIDDIPGWVRTIYDLSDVECDSKAVRDLFDCLGKAKNEEQWGGLDKCEGACTCFQKKVPMYDFKGWSACVQACKGIPSDKSRVIGCGASEEHEERSSYLCDLLLLLFVTGWLFLYGRRTRKSKSKR